MVGRRSLSLNAADGQDRLPPDTPHARGPAEDRPRGRDGPPGLLHMGAAARAEGTRRIGAICPALRSASVHLTPEVLLSPARADSAASRPRGRGVPRPYLADQVGAGPCQARVRRSRCGGRIVVDHLVLAVDVIHDPPSPISLRARRVARSLARALKKTSSSLSARSASPAVPLRTAAGTAASVA